MNLINVAVIGRSWVADKWIAGARTSPEFRLKAIYSRNMADARAFAEKHGAELTFDSLEKLAACPQVDAVYIATPNLFHGPQALIMLRAGKHVCVEKPAAVDLSEAQAMFAAADEAGVVLLEATRNLHNPAMGTLKAALPSLGPVRFARFSYCQYSSKYDRMRAGQRFNIFDPALGNAALMDMGIYLIEPMVEFFGAPAAVTGQHISLAGWDAAGTVVCGYPDMTAELCYSKICDSRIPSEIQGEQAALVIDHIADLTGARIVYRDGSVEALPVSAPENDMAFEARNFLEMAAGRMDPAPHRARTLLSMAVLDRSRAALDISFPGRDA